MTDQYKVKKIDTSKLSKAMKDHFIEKYYEEENKQIQTQREMRYSQNELAKLIKLKSPRKIQKVFKDNKKKVFKLSLMKSGENFNEYCQEYDREAKTYRVRINENPIVTEN